jgi:hypothetical protein
VRRTLPARAGPSAGEPRAARPLRAEGPSCRRAAVSGRGHPDLPVRAREHANRAAIGDPTRLGRGPIPRISRAGCRARGQVDWLADRAPTPGRRIPANANSCTRSARSSPGAFMHCRGAPRRNEVTLLYTAVRWFTHHATAVIRPPLPPGGQHASIAYFEPTGSVQTRRRPLNEAVPKPGVQHSEARNSAFASRAARTSRHSVGHARCTPRPSARATRGRTRPSS